MQLVAGVNHVAVITEDLDRFIDFYTTVFDLDVVFSDDNPAFRHAILRTGPESWLHPVEVAGNPHGAAVPEMFNRGHLDHLSLTAASYESFDVLCDRLVERGACDGDVDDIGAFHSLGFTDPDGMHVELTVIVDPALGASTIPGRSCGPSVDRLGLGRRRGDLGRGARQLVERVDQRPQPGLLEDVERQHDPRLVEPVVGRHLRRKRLRALDSAGDAQVAEVLVQVVDLGVGRRGLAAGSPAGRPPTGSSGSCGRSR